MNVHLKWHENDYSKEKSDKTFFVENFLGYKSYNNYFCRKTAR